MVALTCQDQAPATCVQGGHCGIAYSLYSELWIGHRIFKYGYCMPPRPKRYHARGWVDRRLPQAWRPYTRLARLDRPVGVWLTLFPCWAALIQASHGFPDLVHLIVFSIGALLMRSAGSTVNDIADRKFDGHVERTRFRPGR